MDRPPLAALLEDLLFDVEPEEYGGRHDSAWLPI
jgi:hypothetical protein